MASKATPKRKFQEKEKGTTGRFVATKGRHKNPKYSFESDLENYDDLYADYNYMAGNSNDLYRLSL